MASLSKSDAARANGKKSRGPVTPQGKENSSRNALKHGLTAESATITGESEEDFAELLQAHLDLYQPANAVEKDLVETMAQARWRLRRMASIESNLFENELILTQEDIDDKFDTMPDLGRFAYIFQRQTKPLALLIRYESSLTRLHDRTYKHLKELQKLRNEPSRPQEPPCVSMRTDDVSQNSAKAPNGRRNRLPHHGRSSICSEMGQAVSPVEPPFPQPCISAASRQIPPELLAADPTGQDHSEQ